MIYIYILYIHIKIVWHAPFLDYSDQSHRIGRKKKQVFSVPGAGAPGTPFNIPRVEVQLSVIAGKAWEVLQGQHLLRLCCQVKDLGLGANGSERTGPKVVDWPIIFCWFFWGKCCFKHFKPWDLVFFYVQTNRFSRNPIVIWFWKGLGSVGFPGKGCLTLKPRKHKSSVEIPLLPASERPKNRPGQWNGKGAVAINPSWGNEHPQIPAILMWKPRDSMALADPSSRGIGWDTQFHLVFTTLHLDLIATVMGKVLIYQWNWVYAYAIFELIHEVHKAKISQIPPSGGWKSLSWQN